MSQSLPSSFGQKSSLSETASAPDLGSPRKDIPIRIGIDIGSTTAKIAAVDPSGNLLYKDYRRHNADIRNTLLEFLDSFPAELRKENFALKLTGSAGLGVSERCGIPFIQEVIALNFFAKQECRKLQTVIDIGGEDAKIVFLNPDSIPDMRMNGNCAGGTGAFLDQMASILGMTLQDMDEAASRSRHIHPIASRCGVFSKTDVQNLVAKNVSREDICASIFHAVAVQVVSTLSRGREIKPSVLFCGGPMAFLPSLRKAFTDYLDLKETDLFLPSDLNLLTAKGCAYSIDKDTAAVFNRESLKEKILSAKTGLETASHKLDPIFTSPEQYDSWKKRKAESGDLSAELKDEDVLVIGIDSGSTTTKIVLTNSDGNIVFSHYAKNMGDPIAAVQKGLDRFNRELQQKGLHCSVIAGCSTGYGEELIKKAFDLDFSMVETLAHYTAAKKIRPDVDFILDIGGQDMKALFIEGGVLNRIELNEACSSGCGSFIETFANSLGFTVEAFARKAVSAQNPCDLGTRCTVFMNSKIKQSLREGAAVEDIAAGLAYSVVKNCLYKVLKIREANLGKHIVVQGGSMRNDAVVKALENMLGQEVYRNSRPELMGAYGCSLHAWEKMRNDHAVHRFDLEKEIRPKRSQTCCKGCENNCFIDIYEFENGQRYYSGNKCEKVFTFRAKEEKGENIYAYRNQRIFAQDPSDSSRSLLRLGVPRVLNFYADFPFWNAFFAEFGIELVLSAPSTYRDYEAHLREVMSDNICFPAKLVHAHIHNLYAQKPDRIFFPYVIYENKWDKTEANSYNCPIVSSYNTLIKNLRHESEIPIDNPVFTLKDRKLTARNAYRYLKSLWNTVQENHRNTSPRGEIPPLPSAKSVEKAVDKAFSAMADFQADISARNREILEKARSEHRLCILLSGRPYHTDPLIQHKLSDMIADLGACVINEEILDRATDMEMQDTFILSQWNYINRIIKAAKWVGQQGPDVHYVQMTSFGCGPDAFLTDEVSHMLYRYGKPATIVKIDDINNLGSMQLRIRSLIDSLGTKEPEKKAAKAFVSTKLFDKEDRNRRILAPFFTEYLSPFLPELFQINGYRLEVLPLSDQESAEWGLRFANNEVCYPATLIVGDVIKALKSGKYPVEECAIGITQTGGQCRASNYYPIIKKALVDAGFSQVPVISVSFGSGISNQQPGFRINWMKSIPITLSAVLFGDWLSKFYHATAVRCQDFKAARELRDRYLTEAKAFVLQRNTNGLLQLLCQAADDFNALLPLQDIDLPQVGIVGEIFLKYHPFANKNTAAYLMERGFEVLPPAMLPFFVQSFVNTEAKRENDTDRIGIPKGVMEFFYWLLKKRCAEFEKRAVRFRYYRPSEDVFELAENVKEILPLVVQFGEGWLLPAEIIAHAKAKAKAVLSLQPFGCIANHIISKGLENKIKQKYPGTNILSLDFDSGVSEVNIVNRLRLLLDA